MRDTKDKLIQRLTIALETVLEHAIDKNHRAAELEGHYFSETTTDWIKEARALIDEAKNPSDDTSSPGMR